MKKMLFFSILFLAGLMGFAQSGSGQGADKVIVPLELQAQVQEAMVQRNASSITRSNQNLVATYVGSFETNAGDNWTTNPQVYSGVEAAALLFGGNPSDYAISTNSNTTDPSTITHTAWASVWGEGCQEVAENYSLDLGGPGYNDPMGNGTAVSAYVEDWCFGGQTNYVWAVNTISSPFITTWETTVAGESITIPTTGGGYNYTVQWGDGNTDSGITGDATHIYAAPGTYTVEITGAFPQIFFNKTGDRFKIKSIEQWGSNMWRSMHAAFDGAENLVSNATDIPNLSMVTDMSGMFAFARKFNGDAVINSWDVSNVTNMEATFAGNSVFNRSIANWDVSNVTNMMDMFHGATIFNQSLDTWDVGNVTNMRAMFATALRFNGNIASWNVSNVTDMYGMFAYARKFNADISGWDVSNVTDMYGMFGGCSVFNQDIGSWNVGSVTTMQNMFNGATKFNKDISSWNVSNVTNMKKMFRTAMAFNHDIGGWNVNNVTNMGEMFEHANHFDQDLGNWNISNVTNMTNMFKGIALSTNNYDSCLNNWASQPLKSNVIFSGGNSKYCTGATARQDIINNFTWTITDGGMECPAPLMGERLALGETDIILDITLSPNPMSSYFNLVNPNKIQLENISIYDLTGRLIKTIEVNNDASEVNVDVSDLSASTYLVVVNGRDNKTSKLMVKH